MSERATRDGWAREPARGADDGVVSRGITTGQRAPEDGRRDPWCFAGGAIGSRIAGRLLRCCIGDWNWSLGTADHCCVCCVCGVFWIRGADRLHLL